MVKIDKIYEANTSTKKTKTPKSSRLYEPYVDSDGPSCPKAPPLKGAQEGRYLACWPVSLDCDGRVTLIRFTNMAEALARKIYLSKPVNRTMTLAV